MSTRDKPPVSMRIRLKYPDVETFVEKYSANISEGGMFIQSRAPQAAGTVLRFELVLQDGTPLLKGEGVVIWFKEYDAAHPGRVHGMGLRFAQLDSRSQAMVKRIMAWKKTRPTAAAAPAPPPASTSIPAAAGSSATGPEQAEAEAEDSPTVPALTAAAEQPAELFAALLEQAAGRAQVEAAPAAAGAPVAPPPSPAGRAATLETDLAAQCSDSGDGVAVALEMAEQMLADLLRQSQISEEQLGRTWSWIAQLELGEGDAELQALLAVEQRPQLGLAELGARLGWATPRPETTREPPGDGQVFDDSLLKAAARTARAAKGVSGRGFDTSDGEDRAPPEQPVEAFAPPAPAVLQQALAASSPPPETPSAEAGWTTLQTVTELLDHDSAHVLHDLAQRTRESAAGVRESPQPSLSGDFLVAEPSPPGPAEGDESPLPSLPGDFLAAEPLPSGLAEPDSGGEPLIARSASADALSRSVWREVVSEVAEDLGSGGTPSDSFFDGAAPGDAVLDQPEQSRRVEEPVEDEPTGQPDNVSLSDILSDLDQAIERFGEYEEDSTVVTSGPPSFSDGSRFHEESYAAPRERGREPEPDLTADSTIDTSGQKDLLADFESEPFDIDSQAVRQDPDLDNEVFEALAGLRDTMKEGVGAPPASLDAVPDVEDLARRLDRGEEPAQSPSQELEPLHADQALDEVGGDETGGPKGQIRPRKSGILKRLFGKK